jgi:hypothetical protein
MNITELELNNGPRYQGVILFMKNIGLIKDRSQQRQFHNNMGKIYYE